MFPVPEKYHLSSRKNYQLLSRYLTQLMGFAKGAVVIKFQFFLTTSTGLADRKIRNKSAN
jgi:hypothetical protein